MKLLLTSGGVRNPSIHAALLDLLGKPIAECTALAIPTAGYGGPGGTADLPYNFVTGQAPSPMTGLGWKSVGLLELTALPSIGAERWVPWVREADALLVNGGDAVFLCRWMRESGLADLLPTLDDTVWVGLSAGSMVLTPRVGAEYLEGHPDGTDDRTLGLVDFSICPHVNGDDVWGNTAAEAEQWAAGIGGPAYALDDDTAIKVVDGAVEVVSAGRWTLFNS